MASRTAFQDAQVRFISAVDRARVELDVREWDELLSFLIALLARLSAEQLDREERP
jgi:hypothetical protein